MGVVQLPQARRHREGTERSALRRGVAVVIAARRPRLLSNDALGAAAYCAGCAGPIEFGRVIRGLESYCSVECSLGGDRPA
jgi:hypothetical protein